MKPLPEEHESWVQDLKQHWPDPGEAPVVTPPAQKKPLLFPTVTAAAAAIVLLAVFLPGSEPPAPVPPTVTSIPDWPEFTPSLRASRSLSIPNVRKTLPATDSSTHREDLKRLQSRMKLLKTKQTWRTTP